MDTFSIITDSLKASESKDVQGLDPFTVLAGRVTTAVQSVVDTLTPPDGGRYIVGFADVPTAMTELGARRITVSSAPLNDRRLSLIEKAVVIATLAAHEIGHTIVTRPRGDAVKDHNPAPGYHAVANLADDIILEPLMEDRYPILADAFAFTGGWVLRHTVKALPKVMKYEPGMPREARFNLILAATRYGPGDPITWADARSEAERDWAIGWRDRLIATRLRDDATFLALCDEAWARVRTVEPEDEVETPETPPADEPGDEQGGDDTGNGQPGLDDAPEPTDEDGEDEGEGGSGESEDGDEDGEPGDEPGDGSDDATDDGDDATDDGDGDGDGDEDGEGEGNPSDESGGTDGGGESIDWGDESDADGKDDGDPKAETDSDAPVREGEGGGGNPNTDGRDEDDWNSEDIDKSTHDQTTPDESYRAAHIDQAVRVYSNSSVTAFGLHGTIRTVWE
jgi:hypothetical protein